MATVVLLAAGCTEPSLQEPDRTAEDTSDGEETVIDPATGALHTAIGELQATVAAARDQLSQEPVSAEEVRTALGLLLDDAAEVDDDRLPLLPAVTPTRGEARESGDAFTTVLTLARDAGGELGQSTLEVLRNSIAGDLGAWERDAAGVVETVESAIAGPPPLEQLEQDVLDLPGDATRALAWVLAATRTSDGERIQLYAGRAVAHLDIVLTGLSRLEGPDADPGAVADEDGQDDGGDETEGGA